MMAFDEFIDDIKKGVIAAMGDGYEVKVNEVRKHNGELLTGLTIGKKGSQMATIVYLNEAYQSYIDSGNEKMDPAPVVASLIESYKAYSSNALQPDSCLESMDDYQKIKDRIAFRLMNTKANKEFLKSMPSVPFHDLSIVFFLHIGEDADGISTAQITNDHIKLWNVSEVDLYKEAKKNTPRLLPEVLKGLDKMMERMGVIGMGREIPGRGTGREVKGPQLYILSNRLGIGGAACLLYPGVMKAYANKLKSDLLILPSSVHEILLMPYNKKVDVAGMKSMVQNINASASVPVGDKLSDEVYVYYRLKDKIVIAA